MTASEKRGGKKRKNPVIYGRGKIRPFKHPASRFRFFGKFLNQPLSGSSGLYGPYAAKKAKKRARVKFKNYASIPAPVAKAFSSANC
ncbi:MAG: hypothetical protein LBR53_05500 [Deltaproteobacteria bacterium]|jgi:hypothetical protein|nr:hypothetical protein [Deltaproteobacteria bacterium]